MNLRLIESNPCFGGTQDVYAHWSASTQSEMRFGVYLPPDATIGTMQIPALYWLSGKTCTEQNFITKAGAQRVASQLGIALIVPDTSPRGLGLPHDTDSEHLGEGASLFVDATQEPWSKHYQMYTYVSKELPQLIVQEFPIDKQRMGLFGHSMGGHGALVVGLRNPDIFRSLSAFAPICSATQSAFSVNAFKHYLGEDFDLWKEYDACALLESYPWPHGEILVDQGSADPLLRDTLKPELLTKACFNAHVPLNLRMQEGYNHNYYFISTFIEDHLHFHAKRLNM